MSAGSQQKLSSHAKIEECADNGAWEILQQLQALLYAQTSYLNATLALGQGGVKAVSKAESPGGQRGLSYM